MTKRRSLVLTTESARHWFRMSLPPHVFRTGEPRRSGTWLISRSDWRDVLTTYATAVVCVSVYFG